jgi:RNA polymerase sigma-70 factor (ECF subfamily)
MYSDMKTDLREFGKLLSGVQFDLYAFICILMEGEQDAADVLQDTNLALWGHAERYDAERPFLPWARSFAYNQVRAFRLRQARSRLVFDDTLLDWFAEHAADGAADAADPSDRLRRLEGCLSKLTPKQRLLLRLRYAEEATLKGIAEQVGQSVSAVGVMLHRTRLALAECMKKAAGTVGGL